MEEKLKLQIRHYLTFTIVILLGILIYGGFMIHTLRNERNQLTVNYNALQDTVREIEGKYVIAAFKATNVDDILAIKSTDPAILQLQEAVKQSQKELNKLGGAIASFSNQTQIEKTVPTIVEVPVYLESKDPKIIREPIYPTYKTTSKDEWHDLAITASKDSTYFNLKTQGKYNVILGSEKIKGGLFPKYQTAAFVENISPYEKTNEMRAAVIDKTNKSKVTLGGHIGFGGQYGLLHKQIDVGPQAGVSINFKF